MSIDKGPPLAANHVGDVDAATSTDAGASGENTGAAIPLTPIIFINGLVILPPRQKQQQQQHQSNGATVALPPLRPEEPVASLRGALGEMVGYAHLTRYRLIIEKMQTKGELVEEDEKSCAVATRQNQNKHAKWIDGSSGTGDDQKHPLKNDFIWSPYTLRDADVDMSPLHKSLVAKEEMSTTEDEIVLDDFGDLSILLPLLEEMEVASDNNVAAGDAVAPEGESSTVAHISEGGKGHEMGKQNVIHYDASKTIAIRVVLERYDLASICDHMAKVRNLLKGNAPFVVSLVGCNDDIIDVTGVGSGEKSDISQEKGVNALLPDEDPITTTKGVNKTKKNTTTKKRGNDPNDHDDGNEKNVSIPVLDTNNL